MQDVLLNRARLPAARDKVLVAVSGGLDSSVLLDLLAQHSVTLGIAHMNFQLRGTQSDEDEQFVRGLASKYGKPVFVKRVETNNYATENGLSIQMAARDLRYTWFRDLLDTEGYDYVVTAHHLNDNIETALNHFIRGTGLAGLTGIPEFNGSVFRPLLDCSLAEIRLYAERNELSWREDSSNASDDYGRNFLRHQIVPRLLTLNPSLEETWRGTHERLIAAKELSQLGLDVLKEKYIREEQGSLVISRKLFDAVEHPAGILWEIIKGHGFNLSQCRDITDTPKVPSGKVFFAGSQNRLTVDRDQLIVDKIGPELTEVVIAEEATSALLGNSRIRLTLADASIETPGPGEAVLDRSKLTFPLIWRKWKPGDFFRPSGMKGRKKLSDFLIDRKIAVNQKDKITVIESAGSIVWVVGYRIDERFRATDKTTPVVILTIE